MCEIGRVSELAENRPSDVDHWHRQFAAALFNLSWELLERADRTPQEDDDLLAAVFASRFHWSQVGTAENAAIGDLHVARVCAELGHAELAVRFAAKGLATTHAEGWQDFKLASAHETMARALAAAGEEAGRDDHIEKARAALDLIDDPEDRRLIEDQLRAVPGYRE